MEELVSRLQGSLLRSAWLILAACDSLDQTAKLSKNPMQDSISKNIVSSVNKLDLKCCVCVWEF